MTNEVEADPPIREQHGAVEQAELAKWRKELKELVSKIDKSFKHPYEIRYSDTNGLRCTAQPLAMWEWKTSTVIDKKCNTLADYEFIRGRLVQFVRYLSDKKRFITKDKPPVLLPEFDRIGSDLGKLQQARQAALERYGSAQTNPEENLQHSLGHAQSRISLRTRSIYRLPMSGLPTVGVEGRFIQGGFG